MANKSRAYELKLRNGKRCTQTLGEKYMTEDEFREYLPRLLVGYLVIEFKQLDSNDWKRV